MKAIRLLLVLGFVVSSSAFANHYHILSFGLVLPGIGESKDGNASAPTINEHTSVDNEILFEEALSLGYEFRNIQPYSWGWALGFEYNSQREISKQKIKTPTESETFHFVGDLPSLQANILYLNVIYQWQQFYIPFGLNFVTYQDKNFEDQNGDLKISGGMGGNFALGVQLSNHHFIELDIKAVKFTYENSRDFIQGGTTHTSYADYEMYIPFTSLRYKYAF